MADRVLIVDDDAAICRLLEKVMRSNEMEPVIAGSGHEALDIIASKSFDLILIDVTLGDMEGFDVIRKIRDDGNNTPVMIVSGRNEDYDSLYGLSVGADDYITKPFRPVVLGAKAKALIRRSRSSLSGAETTLRKGNFAYDSETMRFFKGEEELQLSSREAALFLLFLKHPGQVFTKEMLYEQIWGDGVAVDDNTIMVYVNRLRSKIEDDRHNPRHIITVRGIGYRFML
ncbi:MAG: response regulator transcription factor [Lachnospiraceae bacterium]|nr:response regulator transcription factor [Lachnospiraceae bacterium]